MIQPQKLQLDQALRACYLERDVSTQLLHYHVKKAKAKIKARRNAEGWIDDCEMLRDHDDAMIETTGGPTSRSTIGRSVTTYTTPTSSLTDNCSSFLSSPRPAPVVLQQPVVLVLEEPIEPKQRIIKRWKSSRQASQIFAEKNMEMRITILVSRVHSRKVQSYCISDSMATIMHLRSFVQ